MQECNSCGEKCYACHDASVVWRCDEGVGVAGDATLAGSAAAAGEGVSLLGLWRHCVDVFGSCEEEWLMRSAMMVVS